MSAIDPNTYLVGIDDPANKDDIITLSLQAAYERGPNMMVQLPASGAGGDIPPKITAEEAFRRLHIPLPPLTNLEDFVPPTTASSRRALEDFFTEDDKDKAVEEEAVHKIKKKSAIQVLIYKPDPENPLPLEARGVVVNPHHRERFDQFFPIGTYLEGDEAKYYFFDELDEDPPVKIYNSLMELKADLPESLEGIFEAEPKLFFMGHGNGGYYGLGNCHGESEHFYDKKFDGLISSFEAALPDSQSKVFVTLEACNTDSQIDAAANGQQKTFLERLSANHKNIVFGGSAPWDSDRPETGNRSLAPEAPVTSMVGNVWKAGNSVIFHDDECQYAAKKSIFSTSATSRELKINTVNYARAVLGVSDSALIKQIALRRDILKIEDLKKVEGFSDRVPIDVDVSRYEDNEAKILAKEQARYIAKVQGILDRFDRGKQPTNRERLILTLGIKLPSIFYGHKDLQERLESNKPLLNLMMVSCGKTLIGGASNNQIIDRLIALGADINATDERGMTALHYAVQNFSNYAAPEPLRMIQTFLDNGALLDIRSEAGETPGDIAERHVEDPRVCGKEQLLVKIGRKSVLEKPEEVKAALRRIFQMSDHMASELKSLPSERRIYVHCEEGTLYFPKDAPEKLQKLIELIAEKRELIDAFESELNSVKNDLESGSQTGKILNIDDEEIPMTFRDVSKDLEPTFELINESKGKLTLTTTAEQQPSSPKAPI